MSVEFNRHRVIDGIPITLPEPPPLNKIANYDLKKKDQRFYPPNQKTIDAINYELRQDNPELSTRQRAFVRKEFKRRKEGYWFFNNGNLEYVTGLHYFYLSAWKIPISKEEKLPNGEVITNKGVSFPDWTDSDRDYFYVWHKCYTDPLCVGMIHVTNRRDGKALALDTKIPTPIGWSTMAHIKEGDQVFDSEGNICNVTFATGIQHDRKCYKINFSDKTHIIADEDHMWIAYNKSSRQHLRHDKWQAKKHVVTTSEMLDSVKIYNNESNWSIQNCKPVKYKKKELLIPPYILGLWLGDGDSARPNLTSVDQQLIDEWSEYGESIGLKVSRIGDISYNLVMKSRNKGGRNEFRRNLDRYSLTNNKHIPPCYLQSSVDDRVSLLQGLMDTDGCVNTRGRTFEFCQKNRGLCLQFKELVESLGIKCTMSYKLNKKYNKRYYYVRFGSTDIVPFRLKRKIEKIKPRSGGWRNDHRYITSIEPVKSVPVKCIEVDSPDHSYLCGENFVVTHNTHRSNATNFEIVSRTNDVKSAIQSKTSGDAKTVFLKMVRSWQRLPEYYKPVDVGDSFPQTVLRFDEPAKRTTKTQNKDYSNVRRSEIYHINSKEEALDGEDLIFVLHDEVGKTNPKDANVAERVAIVRECVSDGSSVTGKILCTTTVEEMEKKGGKECKLIWDNSDFHDKNAIGQTNTGLYRYFKPADYGLRGKDEKGKPFIDEYGYSDVERTRKYLQKRRAKLTGAALSAECRKYPLTVQEAFYLDSKSDVFPAFNIHEQLQYNTTLQPGMVRIGNFIWVGDGKLQAEFVDDPNGRWAVSWMPPKERRNLHTPTRIGPMPLNEDGAFGIDPFDHKTTVDNRKSNAASYGFRKFNPMDQASSHGFVCQYIARPDTPEMFYDDMAKQCVFYGWKALIENQKPGLINWMRTNKFYHYVMKTKQSDYTKSNSRTHVDGISMSGDMVREAMINKLVDYIYHNVGRVSIKQQHRFGIGEPKENMPGFCYFNDLLEDWLNFDVLKWTDYDPTVASGITLLAVKPVKRKIVKEEAKGAVELFPKYNIRGNTSTRR